jgi:hypothetical protein
VQCGIGSVLDGAAGVTHFLGVSSLDLRPQVRPAAFFLAAATRPGLKNVPAPPPQRGSSPSPGNAPSVLTSSPMWRASTSRKGKRVKAASSIYSARAISI